ncbi:monocarboxylate transporter 14 isoform X2 [Protopterus annectens]|uniref:monocarboxylate transporter 14 isoform X2 n=1 Tax=Protopterus annectens TaxID=7888 RepID=UPI001CFA6241|nr:monocarboxylate transporter 14 isoform X2 [Protopterus annectens]
MARRIQPESRPDCLDWIPYNRHYIDWPFIGFFINVCGCRKTAMIGGIVTAAGWILSAYATSIYYLYISFGVTAGIGSGMSYLPTVVMVGHYFQKRRALAQGLSTTGSGFGTFLITILLKYLCRKFGWRDTMFIVGAICLNLCVSGALLRPMPVSKMKKRCSGTIWKENCNNSSQAMDINEGEEKQKTERENSKSCSSLNENKHFLVTEQKQEKGNQETYAFSNENTEHFQITENKREYKKEKQYKRNIYPLSLFKAVGQLTNSIKRGFWTWQSSYFGSASLFKNKAYMAFVFWALFAYAAFVILFIYLPEIVKLYGLSEQNDTFPLTSIIAIIHIFGKIILGLLGDVTCISAWNVFLLANLTLCICILIVPLMHSYIGLAFICALVGFSGGYFSIMPVVTEDLVGIDHLANAYGIIICANGISALWGPPFAGWIYDISHKYDFSFYICGMLYMVGIISLLPCLQSKKKKTSDDTPVAQV